MATQDEPMTGPPAAPPAIPEEMRAFLLQNPEALRALMAADPALRDAALQWRSALGYDEFRRRFVDGVAVAVEPAALYDAAREQELLGDFARVHEHDEDASLPLAANGSGFDLRLLPLPPSALDPLRRVRTLLRSQGSTALLGPSGCGKTSTIFNLTFGHDGHEDWVVFLDCTPEDEETTEPRPGCFGILWRAFTAATEATAQQMCDAYALANLALLLKLRHVKPNITPREFLLLQLGEGKRFVAAVFEALLSERPGSINTLLRAAAADLGVVVLAIDEAAAGLKVACTRKSVSADPLNVTACLLHSAECCRDLRVLLAGTSLTLAQHEQLAVGGDVKYAHEFGPVEEPAVQRLCALINLDGVDMDGDPGLCAQLQLLNGRARNALFVLGILARQDGAQGADRTTRFRAAVEEAVQGLRAHLVARVQSSEYRRATLQAVVRAVCAVDGLVELEACVYPENAGATVGGDARSCTSVDIRAMKEVLDSALFYVQRKTNGNWWYALLDPLCVDVARKLIASNDVPGAAAEALEFAASMGIDYGKLLEVVFVEGLLLLQRFPMEHLPVDNFWKLCSFPVLSCLRESTMNGTLAAVGKEGVAVMPNEAAGPDIILCGTDSDGSQVLLSMGLKCRKGGVDKKTVTDQERKTQKVFNCNASGAVAAKKEWQKLFHGVRMLAVSVCLPFSRVDADAGGSNLVRVESLAEFLQLLPLNQRRAVGDALRELFGL